jgi:hypothetical protein
VLNDTIYAGMGQGLGEPGTARPEEDHKSDKDQEKAQGENLGYSKGIFRHGTIYGRRY